MRGAASTKHRERGIDAKQPLRSDDYALRRTLRTGITRLISTGQRAGIFRAGDPQALATLIMAGLDARLSTEGPSDGDSQGRDADVSEPTAPNAG
jgi:hypothetical protein